MFLRFDRNGKKSIRINLQAKTKISKYYLLFMNTVANVEHAKNIKLIYLPFLRGIFLIIFSLSLSRSSSSLFFLFLFQHEIFIITFLCGGVWLYLAWFGGVFISADVFSYNYVRGTVRASFHSKRTYSVRYQYFLCIQVFVCERVFEPVFRVHHVGVIYIQLDFIHGEWFVKRWKKIALNRRELNRRAPVMRRGEAGKKTRSPNEYRAFRREIMIHEMGKQITAAMLATIQSHMLYARLHFFNLVQSAS